MRRMPKKPIKFAAFTICTKNYLAFARTLMKSFLKYNPQASTFILLLDRIDGYFKTEEEDSYIIEVEELKNVPNLESFIFKYDVIGLNTAVKPYFIEYLFNNFDISKLIYFDTDIMVFGSLEKINHLLDKNNIVLIPHILSPIQDEDKTPSERDLLLSGSYNLGFIGLKRSTETMKFVKWWEQKTYDGAISAVEKGLFRDQKPVDLVPSLFDGVYISKEMGYNVAYWNLHERNKFEEKNGKFFVNGKPLIFFHYSGYSLEDPHTLSKYQNRYRFADFGSGLKRLFNLYKKNLLQNGYKDFERWPYFFGYFDNGIKIHQLIRDIYWSLGKNRLKFGNPYQTSPNNSFFKFLTRPHKASSKISFLLHTIYLSRQDLQSAFLDIDGSGNIAFQFWAQNNLGKEYDFEDKFVEVLIKIGPVKKAWGSFLHPRIVFYQARRSKPAKLMKKGLKKLLGDKNFLRLKGGLVGLAAKARFEEKVADENIIIGGKNINGVNIFGYFNSMSGMGEKANALANLLKESKISTFKVDLEEGIKKGISGYPINIFVVNANDTQGLMRGLGKKVFEGKYNIGSWAWELSKFPDLWANAFNNLSEVWVDSDFCLDAISKPSPIPVVKIPWRVSVKPSAKYSRADFGIKEEEFVFLFIFNWDSFARRKNPEGVISSFQKAFADGVSAKLIIKSVNVPDEDFKKLKNTIEGSNITLINEDYDRERLLDLLVAADCYVSLHRGEGFGATIFEAMNLGKPVITTAYSGNMDFTNLNNSFLVKYNLAQIEENIGPYKKGDVWAQPSIDHAVELMRDVFDNKEIAKMVGEKAKQDIEEIYGWPKLSAILSDRIKTIQRKMS